MRPIKSKTEFYALSRQGLLGNWLRQFDWQELVFRRQAGTLSSLIGVRHVGNSFSTGTRSFLATPTEAIQYGWEHGAPDPPLLFDEAAPTEHIVLHAEIAATERGLYVRHSCLPVHQRELWEIDRRGEQSVVTHTWGLKASHLLRSYLDDPSWECLNEILSGQRGEDNSWGGNLNFAYPVVEISCFDISVGELNWNTLFWEVRTDY